MVVVKCKMLEINQIIIFKEPFFKEYLTYFQPTITLHYHGLFKPIEMLLLFIGQFLLRPL